MALTKITSRILDSSGVTILGTIATGVWQGTAIADDHIASAATWNTASTDRLKWDGGATGLTASTGRTSLGLGTVATTAASDYATAAQGTKADTAHGWGNHTGGGYVKTTTDQTIGGAKTFSSNILIASGEYLSWGTIGATSIEGSTASNKIQFRTGSGNRMIINNTGVGIGTTSPSQQLHLYSGAGGGSAPDSRTKLLIEDNGEAYLGFNVPATSFTGIRLQFAGTTKAMFECWDQAAQTPQVRIGSVDSRPVNLQTDNTPRLTVLGTSGNVGIGTTSPSAKLNTYNATTSTQIIISGGDATNQRLEVTDGTVINRFGIFGRTTGDAGVIGTQTNHPLIFNTNDSEKMRITSGGDILLSSTEGKIGIKDSNSIYIGNFEGNNVGLRFIGVTNDIRPCTSSGDNQDNTVDLGDANARFKDFYLSGGVYLGGTAAVNKLDAYEEGTWSALYKNNTGDTMPVGATTDSNCEYTRIGNKVYISGYIDTSGGSSVSGAWIVLDNLPYAPDTSAGFWGGITIMTAENFAGDYPSTGLVSSFSTSSFKLHYRNASDGGTFQLAPSDLSTAAGASNRIRFHGFYSV